VFHLLQLGRQLPGGRQLAAEQLGEDMANGLPPERSQEP
jgi:hypothetical protein